MNRNCFCVSIEGRCRVTWRILALEEEPARLESVGMYVPDSRKDFMLDMRRREEAEGETRTMGSGRRLTFLSREARDVVVVAVDGAVVGFLRSLKKVSECLRTWEKSCGDRN